MPAFLKMIIEKLVTKKKMVAWASAALIAITGAAIGMDSVEVKSAICDVK